MVLENCVRYIEVSAIKRSIPIEDLQLVPEYGVRYSEVSAIKHVRYREVPLYTRETQVKDATRMA